MGSYLRPPKIFAGNTNNGVVLKSTDPWNAQTTAGYGLRTDTTYYYQVKTVDAGLATSGWSASGTVNTGVAPSTSTLNSASGAATGEINLAWMSAGDDGMKGNLTGNYRIQYATYTASWSTTTTPTNATTVTLATNTVTPGATQTKVVTGLTVGTTYYFVMWSQDDVNNWSGISNTTSAVPSAPITVTLAEAVGQAGWMGRGETQRILGTAQVVSDSESGVTISSVAVQASGYTADGNLTNVEVWVSSSGYIDANAIRLDGTAKAFSSNSAVFDQDVVVSTTPLYFIARSDVGGSATEGTFELSLQVYTTAIKVNNPIAFSNATDVVAPPSGTPSGLTATAASNLLQVNLSWSGATGADSYTIYRATYSGVTTTDFILGMTNATSFADDTIPPNHLMYYKVVGLNRAGATSLSNVASDTSVDVPALTTSNIYLRAGVPSGYGNGGVAYWDSLSPLGTMIDRAGNLYATDTVSRIKFTPKVDGTYFGQSMTAHRIYTIAGTGTSSYNGDGVLATTAHLNLPRDLAIDVGGNVYIADQSNHRIRFVPKTGGTYFGQAMTANYIYTIAGTGTGSYGGDGGAATSTPLNSPYGVSVDLWGNVAVADYSNHRIRIIAKTSGTYFGQSMTANNIYTIAGDGTGAYNGDNVVATSGQIKQPRGASFDVAGNLFIADTYNYRIRFVPRSSGSYFGQTMTANYLYTIAGSGTFGFLGDGGAAVSAQFRYPSGVAVDEAGNVLIADTDNQRIRFVARVGGTNFGQSMTANNIYTIAGNGTIGFSGDGGVATSGQLNYPYRASVDPAGNVNVADYVNRRVRMIPKGNGAYFGQSMTANCIYTIAGEGAPTFSGEGTVATSGKVNGPRSVHVDARGNIYEADYGNHRILFVPKTAGTYYGQSMEANGLYTVAGNGTGAFSGDGGLATSGSIKNPIDVTLDENGNIYIADYANERIRFVPQAGGTYFGQTMTANYIYTLVGDGTGAYGGNAGPAVSAQIWGPTGVSIDAEGNLYIADFKNHRIRFVAKTGGTYFGQAMTANYIYTIAGDGTASYGGDTTVATAAQLNFPRDVSIDVRGNVYIADRTNHRIRFVPKAGGTYFGQSMTANNIYTIVGDGTGSFSGDGGICTSARLNSPSGVSVDVGGNVYIADTTNGRIRFVPVTGGTYFGQARTANYIYTIGGAGSLPYNGENAVATGKYIIDPYGVFAASDHMVYLTDNNNKIRMIAGEDFIAPSTSTLAATAGLEQVTLNWTSAGDDGPYNAFNRQLPDSIRDLYGQLEHGIDPHGRHHGDDRHDQRDAGVGANEGDHRIDGWHDLLFRVVVRG
jgi:hypothetical protein